MKPSVGRIVHYVSYGTPGGEFSSVCRAAIITEVHAAQVAKLLGPVEEETASLCVLNPTGQFFNTKVPYSPEPRSGTWHWPERVDD